MNDTKVVGRYSLIARDRRTAEIASLPPVKDKIGYLVQKQVERRGDDKSFTFKALGFLWQYTPGDK